MHKIWGAALIASLVALPAYGHGGGGGGGVHTSTHYVFIPVYMGRIVPAVPPAEVGSYGKIHTVAILSGVGQTMTLGRSALLTAHSSFSIADWNFDHAVEDVVARDLTPRYTIKPVAHDSAALAAIPNGHFDTSSEKALQAYIAALPDHSVDAFVVIRPDAQTGTPVTPGLSFDATRGRPREEANFEIDIVDAKSGIVIADAFSRAAERQGVPIQFAEFWASPDLHLMPNDVPSNAQRNQLKKDFERDMSLALRETLRSLMLGITLPPVGARTITPLTADENPGIKVPKLMIVSALGDSIEVDRPGTLFDKRKDQTFQVADWGMDAEFETRARAGLDPHFTPVTVPVDRAKLAAFSIPNTNVIGTVVPGITPGLPGVDSYAVLVKMHSKTNDDTTGLTEWSRGGDGYGGIFSQYAFVIVDAKTGRILLAASGVTSPKYPSALPYKMISTINLPAPGAAGFSPDQQSAAHILFTQMMNDSIDEMLLRLRMTGRKIEDGGADLADASIDDDAQSTNAQPSQ